VNQLAIPEDVHSILQGGVFNVWGGTYFFAFDVLFAPNVTIEKRSGKKLGKGWYTFCNTTRQEAILNINLPKEVIVLDIKNMLRVIEDHSLGF
jgi:hypothetical protein